MCILCNLISGPGRCRYLNEIVVRWVTVFVFTESESELGLELESCLVCTRISRYESVVKTAIDVLVKFFGFFCTAATMSVTFGPEIDTSISLF